VRRGLRAIRARALTSAALEQGQALIEYALILMLVATVCAGVLSQLGANIIGPLEDAAQGLV
jgi:Flp pilus assembly pilin Flp